MSNLSLAFKAFFSILFSGKLPTDVALAFGYARAMPTKSTPAPAPSPTPAPTPKATPAPTPQAPPPTKTDAAAQLLASLQQESRIVDFLMEDLSGATDDQIGAVVRDVQTKAREALMREVALEPVIDGVEGTYTATEGLAKDVYRLVGNVPPNGKAPGGMLRHRGWKTKAGKVVAPAELEIE